MAALSVLVVLDTLVIPICSRLGGNGERVIADHRRAGECSAPLPEQLTLQRVSGAIFADSAGRRYRVTPAEVESGAVPNGNLATPG